MKPNSTTNQHPPTEDAPPPTRSSSPPERPTRGRPPVGRRSFIGATLLASLGLAGCLDDRPSSTPTRSSTATETATPTPSPPSSDWPTLQRDARRQGWTTDDGPTEEPTVSWSMSTGADVTTGTASSPAVYAGSVFVGREDGGVVAVDSQTGEERWLSVTDGRVDSSPAVVDRMVYLGSTDGSVYAFDAVTGEDRWSFATGAEVFSSPAVAEGVVYVGSWDMHLYALDAASGAQRWKKKVGALGYSSPAVSDGLVFCGSGPREFDGDSYVVADADKRAYAFDAATGEQRWAASLGDVSRSSPPAVAGGTVYLGCEDGRVYALDSKTGEEAWTRAVGTVDGSPAIAERVVYVAATGSAGGGSMVALDADSGEPVWKRPLNGSPGLSSPVVAEGVVYVGDNSGHVQAFDVESGEKRWELSVGSAVDSSPAVVDGALYVSTATDLRALE